MKMAKTISVQSKDNKIIYIQQAEDNGYDVLMRDIVTKTLIKSYWCDSEQQALNKAKELLNDAEWQ